jgi:excisionase family DNA binding protein
MADWITTDEAVTLSGYNLDYLRRLIRAKKINAEKKGGQFWVDRRSLLHYIEAAKNNAEDKRVGPKKKSS